MPDETTANNEAQEESTSQDEETSESQPDTQQQDDRQSDSSDDLPDDLGDAGKRAIAAEREARQEAEQQLKQFRTEMDEFKSGIAKALGLSDDEDEPDPDRLQDALAERDAENRQLRVLIALGDVLTEHNAHPKLTRAVLREEGVLDKLDPDADDFTEQLDAAVEKAVEENPQLLNGQTPSLGSADQGARGGNRAGQLSRDQIADMSPEEIVKAKQDGRLDELLGA